MAYLLYSLSFALLVFATALYITRARWLPHVPSSYLYTRLPSSFRSDLEAGLSSSSFDLTTNLDAGDTRAGLDDQGKREVQRIMKARGVGFDEARRVVVQQRFERNGIGPDGRPRDPKFVSFS